VRALLTARTMRDKSTVTPVGMPRAQADASALPRAMFTSVISSFTATSPPASQSPTQVLAVSIAVGVGESALVKVGVDVGRVFVGVRVEVAVGV
jgi:hypothetical protein